MNTNLIKKLCLSGLMIISTLTLSACMSTAKLKPGSAVPVLKENEGYLGFVINTLDDLQNIQFKNMQTGEEFYVGSAKKGLTQITLVLTEGEYCFVGFDVYNLRVDYRNKGFCTYLEAGDLNYFAEFMIRDPVSTSIQKFNRYRNLLKKDFPQFCTEYIGKGC